MCFPISDDQVEQNSRFFSDGSDEDCVFSSNFGTARWIHNLTELRNDEDSRLDSTFAKRSLGAIGYPTLALVALVEVVVRVAFALLALIPSLLWACFDKGSALNAIYTIGVKGAAGGLEMVVRCGVGFVKNFYREQMLFTDLQICGARPSSVEHDE